MENKIFKSRKKILENFFKKKIVFNVANEENDGFNSSTVYISNILNYQLYNKEFIKKLKDFSYYLMSKSINEENILDCISISTFIPYVDNNDEILSNPTFEESSLLHEKIRVLKLDKLQEEYFLKLFDFLYMMYVDEHEYLLHPIKNFKFFVKGKTRKKNIINLPKCFKSSVCIVCLTGKPRVIFCNCGHIPICTECSKIKKFTECPVCKNLNEIVRIIE